MFPPFRPLPGADLFFNMAQEKNKLKVAGYIVIEGKIGFLNYRNKIFKSVEIKKVMEKYYDQIEEMAEENIT